MASSIVCPECGGQNTIRKGVCFRCGHREPKSTPLPVPAPKPAPVVTPPPPSPKPFPAPVFTPPPPTPSPSPVYPPTPAASPVSADQRNAVQGKITSLGTPRTEVVELKWGDILSRTAVSLTMLVLILWGLITFFWIVVIVLLIVLLVPPIRSMLPFLLMMRRGGGKNNDSKPEDIEIPVTPFTITTSSGESIEVVLRGELQGGSPHLGDTVEVHGRRSGNGTIKASSVVNIVTGAKTTTREHPAATRSRWKAIGGGIVTAVMLFLLISVVGYFMQGH